MNFDRSLKAAMPAAEEPRNLRVEINRAIAHNTQRTRILRRLAMSLATTAAVVAIFVTFPTLSAQAALKRISGALTSADQFVARRYTIDPQGNRFLAGVQTYAAGQYRMERARDNQVMIQRDGKRFMYDPFTKSYIVQEADQRAGDLKLTSVIESLSAWANDVDLRSDVLNGRNVEVATITSRDLPERLIVVAEAKSSLPIVVYSEALERGRWRRTSVTEMEYGVAVPPESFDLSPDIPSHSEEEWRELAVKAMLARSVAKTNVGNTEINFRAVEVAADGTVFVAYQSGLIGATWRGATLELQDDLGATYSPMEMINIVGSPFSSVSKKKGGTIEVAVFVPVNRNEGWRPRRLTFKAHADVEGNLVRLIQSTVRYSDGWTESRLIPNHSKPGLPTTWSDQIVLRWDAASPTCTERPSFMTLVDYGSWRDDLVARLTKAQQRQRYFSTTLPDDANAEIWRRESSRLMDEIESQGGGPYRRSAR